MTIQDRRRQRLVISGRRILTERRITDGEFSGQDRRNGGNRRTIIDRRR